MNKTERTQIAQTLRATAQKLSAKALPGDKWDEDGVNDAIKELVQTAMGRDETASTFKLKNQDLWLLDDAVLGWQNVKKHTGEFPSDDKAMVKRVEDAVKKNLASAPSASTVKAKTKVRAASGKPGSLKDGIWQGEVVSEKSTLTDILESLDQDHLAKLMSDTMGNFDSDYVPDAGELARMNSSKVPDEASRIFADAAGNAYRSAWENAAEGYFVKTVTENLISLLNDASGTAQYTGEDTDGEEVEVEVDFDVTAKETGDVDGVFSNPYIEVTITNPGHLSNYAEWVLSGERTTAVDVLAELGDVAEDADRVATDLHEPTVHRHVEHGAVGERDPRVVLGERTEERGMTGQKRDLATTQGAGDDLRGLAGEEHLLRRHQLDRHRCHDQAVPSWRALALASTCSTPPTFKNACSGTSSSSPRRMASKLSTVSATGTVSPGTLVNTSAT